MKKSKKLLISLVVIFALMSLFMIKSEAKTPYDSITFDTEYYLNKYPDVKNAFGDNYGAVYNHYLTCGISEGRDGSPYFDIGYYLKIHDDLQKAFKWDRVSAYNHFITFGIKEGRSGSPYINPKYYLDNYSDLKKAFGKNYEAAYNHFYNFGISEGRRGSKFFNVKYYLENHQDLQSAFGKKNYSLAFNHYLNYGINEGRNPSEDVNIKCYLATYKDLQDVYGKKGYRSAAEHCYTFTIGLGEKRKTTHEIVSIKEVKPTCVDTGSKGGEKCQNCGEIIKKPTTVKTIAHNWTLEKVEWVNGKEGVQAKATMKCTVANHKNEETTDVDFGDGRKTKEPSCDEDGETTYSDITVKYGGKTYKYDKVLTVSIPELGHLWTTEVGSMSGKWSGTYYNPTAVVTRTCIRNLNHKQEASSVEYVVDSETSATCTEKGSIRYYAKAKFDGDDKVYDVKTIAYQSTENPYEIPELGHNWKTTIDENDITWENVGESNSIEEAIFKAKIKCSRDDSHTKEIELTTTEGDNGKIDVVEVPANCGNKGKRIYTATVKYTDPNGTFEGKTGHSYTYQGIEKETVLTNSSSSEHAGYVWENSDNDNDGMLNFKCSGCGDIDKTIIRVITKDGLKSALENNNYETIEIASNIDLDDEVITVSRNVKIVGADDGSAYTLTGTAENLFKVTATGSVEFDEIKLAGGSNGAILAENGAEIKASETVIYETESYNKPFVVTEKSNNANVIVNGEKVTEFTNIQERVPFSGVISEEDFVIRIGDSLKQKETNNKYYYLDSSKKDNFVKITYIGDRAITLKVINYTVWYDKEKNEPQQLEPQDIEYLTKFEGKLANYTVAKWQNMSNPSDTVDYGKVPAPESDISYIAEMKAEYIDTEHMKYIGSEDGIEVLKEAVKSNSTYKTVVIKDEIDLSEKLVIEKEGIMITGSISGAPEIDGTLKGEIEVKANNVKFAKVKVVGNKATKEDKNYVVTIDENAKSFRSSEVEYLAEALDGNWDGLLYFAGDDPKTTLFFNTFNGDNSKSLVEFGKEIKGENDAVTEDTGTKLTGNKFISGTVTENQVIISKIADMTGEKEVLNINQNDVDLSKNKSGNALYIKEVGSNVVLNIGSVYFLNGGKQDNETKYKIKIDTLSDNLKVTFPSTRGGFTTEKWEFDSSDNTKITVTQNVWNEEEYKNTPKTYDGNGTEK